MTPSAAPDTTVTLPGGAGMPLLGFGTWQLTGVEATAATGAALAAGYRHLDTATMYRNEAEVGSALARSIVPRAEVFLTTKLQLVLPAASWRRCAAASTRCRPTTWICGSSTGPPVTGSA